MLAVDAGLKFAGRDTVEVMHEGPLNDFPASVDWWSRLATVVLFLLAPLYGTSSLSGGSRRPAPGARWAWSLG